MGLKKIIVLVFLILVLANVAFAANVGVVVKLSDSKTIIECVNVKDNSNGYTVLQKTSLDIGWSEKGEFGHALCNIDGVGDSVSGTGCKWGPDNYWAFLVSDGSKWEYSSVGFDAGTSCWNRDLFSYDGHYCARDKEVIGLAYGPYGSKPDFYTYEAICSPKLSIDEVTAYVNGVKDSGTIEAFPDSMISLKVKVENLLEDIEISEIIVKATIEGIDNGEDIDKESGSFKLSGGKSKQAEIELVVPNNAEQDEYDIVIEAEGKDENGVVHTTEERLNLKVVKEKHSVNFEQASLSKTSASCGEQITLTVKLKNEGMEKESGSLKIISEKLGISLKDSFILGDSSNSISDEYLKTYLIKIPSGQKEGNYPILLRADYSKNFAEKELSINVKCTKTAAVSLVKNTAAPKKLEANTANLIVEGKKTNNNQYISAVIITIEAIAILSCVLIIAGMLR